MSGGSGVQVLTFVGRRVLAGLATLLVAVFVMYLLVDRAIDPLADLRTSTAPNRAELVEQRTQLLSLDTPAPARFVRWLGGVVTGDLGVAWRSGQDVGPLLAHAVGSTLQLVTAATLLSVVLGVGVGVVSALRQYSAGDHLVVVLSFVLYSLPSFWVAVLLKQWGAIGFNDFLEDPVLPWTAVAALAVVTGLALALAVGGSRRRRAQTFLLAAAATAAMVVLLQVTDWWLDPGIGPLLLAVIGAGAAFAVTAVVAGRHHHRALLASLATVAVGVALHGPLQVLFARVAETHWLIAGLGVLAVAVGACIGHLLGAPDRAASARAAALTAVVVGALVVVDQVMQVWPAYVEALRGRPVPTFGDRTPTLSGTYWVHVLDALTHLALPTVTLTLIAFAGYARYSRASMLEVMSQDYIRTARAKGLTERVVVMRHGFRNTLIPLATVVPVDVITLIGGAVITEAIFARPGMGQLFVQSLRDAEIDPVMAYLLITAALAITATIVADVLYALADPRVRLTA